MQTSNLRFPTLLKVITHVRFHTSTVVDPYDHLIRLLQSSIDLQSPRLTQQSHARILSLGLDQDPFLATKLISAYSISRTPSYSRLVFHSIRRKNIFLWNSLISGYVKNHVFDEPFSLFNQMRRDNESPDNYTFATISKICGEIEDLGAGKTVHCQIIRSGFVSDTVVMNSVVAMYCKCGNLDDACGVFEEMPQRSAASWNVLICEYAMSGGFRFSKEIWGLVKQMQVEGVEPDAFTVASLLPLCGTENGNCAFGREIHCYITRNELCSYLDLGSDLHIGSCLIDMYSKSKNLVMARRVFDRMKSKNIVAWTAMIAGYAQNGVPEEALMLFRTMLSRDGILPNRVSIVSILPACSSLAGLMEGKQVHGFSVRSEMNNDASVNNSLIDMYCKCGSLKSARRIFDDDSFCKDAITWSSMIAGYGLHGKGEEAILLFNEMLRIGMKLDAITFVGVLSACGRAGLLDEGFQIYNLLSEESGVLPTMEICSCMVDMLGRAGQIDQALNFIKSMPMKPGPSVWAALLSASAIHGNREIQDLAYASLLHLEPEMPSNYVSLSNIHAYSGRWDVVAEVRMRMKEKGLRKLPGCSWISVNSKIHSFYVADKSHPCSDIIYLMLNNLIITMKGVDVPDIEYLT